MPDVISAIWKTAPGKTCRCDICTLYLGKHAALEQKHADVIQVCVRALQQAPINMSPTGVCVPGVTSGSQQAVLELTLLPRVVHVPKNNGAPGCEEPAASTALSHAELDALP
jgi:hypothetical protein